MQENYNVGCMRQLLGLPVKILIFFLVQPTSNILVVKKKASPSVERFASVCQQSKLYCGDCHYKLTVIVFDHC